MKSTVVTGHEKNTVQREECAIYTIGHSNLSMERFVSLLKSNAIEMVVDIRTRPFSSYVSHFNRPNLEQTLKRKGIEYVFMGNNLGGYPKDPDCYIRDPGSDKRTPDYTVMAAKDWFKQGLKAVIEIAQDKRVVLAT